MGGLFSVVSHNSIRGCVHPSVGPSVRGSRVFFGCPNVCKNEEYRKREASRDQTTHDLFRVYELVSFGDECFLSIRRLPEFGRFLKNGGIEEKQFYHSCQCNTEKHVFFLFFNRIKETRKFVLKLMPLTFFFSSIKT